MIDRVLARERAALPEKRRSPGVIENEVLVGKDGWLFLWDGSNEVHRYYTDLDYFTDEDAQNWADLLTTRRDRIEERRRALPSHDGLTSVLDARIRHPALAAFRPPADASGCQPAAG